MGKTSRLSQKHSKMKDGEKKEDMFRMVQMSSVVDEPQDKGCYTEVGEGLRKFRNSVGTRLWGVDNSKD